MANSLYLTGGRMATARLPILEGEGIIIDYIKKLKNSTIKKDMFLEEYRHLLNENGTNLMKSFIVTEIQPLQG